MERWVKVSVNVHFEHRGLTELSDDEIVAEVKSTKFGNIDVGPGELIKVGVVNVKIEDDEPTDAERRALNHKTRFGFGG